MNAPMILKGVGKINGDGWKDTTKVGEVVYAWNAELPNPYKEGQFPRVGCPGWSASTTQYDFTPATMDEVMTADEERHSEFLRLKDEIAGLKADRDAHLRARCEFGDVIANHCIAMQAALIEWYGSGTADRGMQWIENTLSGPGLLPDMKEAAELGGAQAWFDAKMAEHEAFRAANPAPARPEKKAAAGVAA
jgi:hypothetical protein